MENACWQCGELGHHKRECQKEEVDVHFKVAVRDYRNRATHSSKYFEKGQQQLAKYAAKISEEFEVPDCLVKQEIERLHDLLYDIGKRVEQYPTLIRHTDVGVLEKDKRRLEMMKARIAKEFEVIRYLRLLMKMKEKEWLNSPVMEIPYFSMKTVSALQPTVNDALYRSSNNIRLSIIALTKFANAKDDLEDYFAKAFDAFESGRPLLLKSVLDEWEAKRAMYKRTIDQLQKHFYLFEKSVVTALKGDIEVVKEAWKALKNVRESHESHEMSKTTCKICCTNEVAYTLGCGHLYCPDCVSKIQQCSFCRATNINARRILF